MFICMGVEPDHDLIASITADIMKCFYTAGLFESSMISFAQLAIPLRGNTAGETTSYRRQFF